MKNIVKKVVKDNLKVVIRVFDMHFDKYKEKLKSDLRKESPITGSHVGIIKSCLNRMYYILDKLGVYFGLLPYEPSSIFWSS